MGCAGGVREIVTRQQGGASDGKNEPSEPRALVERAVHNFQPTNSLSLR
jgi:hypothetical protein